MEKNVDNMYAREKLGIKRRARERKRDEIERERMRKT